MRENDMPAFPNVPQDGGPKPGLTKREYIATAVLQGMLSNASAKQSDIGPKVTPKLALKFADALLAELARPQ